MESSVESGLEVPIELRLLGPIAVLRDGTALALPPSRKVRALLAYLALSAQPVPRGRLAELLWDVPNDPRGELRWSLSKARTLLDAPGRVRVVADADTVRLDLSGDRVDALDILAATQSGLAGANAEHLAALDARFGGDFLAGLEIPGQPAFAAWLLGQRRRFRGAQAAILEHLAARLPAASDAAVAALERWLALAPFDRRAHAALLDALARRGQIREGDEHLAAMARQFEAEAQDWAPIGRAWRAARDRAAQPIVVAGPEPIAAPTRRASIAVMPFAAAAAEPRGGLADALAFDVITRLAKLRSLFVIAPGTVFALHERSVGGEDAARRLDVDYVASGSLRREGGRIELHVQLVQTRSARVLWADALAAPAGEALGVLDEIVDRIVVAVAGQVELAERNAAILKAPNSLDAWEAHHRGLWHMYRFHRDDNEQARRFFEAAIRLDPSFARPYAGLSFTHFQNAFLGWGERESEIERAYASASQALMADDLDPAAHWAMSRALWLRRRREESLAEIDTTISLSPNFALAHYTRGFFHAQSGDPAIAIEATDHSRALSPFDPLLFAMLCTRGLALMRLGRHEEAADWTGRAAARPNAHVHIRAIAAHCAELAGRRDDADAIAASIRRERPDYRSRDLIEAFHFGDDALASLRRVSARIGLG